MAGIPIAMPRLGMTMEEGKLLEWSKAEKDRITKGDILFAIESDKVTYEVVDIFGASFEPFTFAGQAPGAFMCLGLMLCAMNFLGEK